MTHVEGDGPDTPEQYNKAPATVEDARLLMLDEDDDHDHQLSMAFFLHLVETCDSPLGKPALGLMISKVFNDLMLHLSARSVQRVSMYGHRLVKELPNRARLFSLGIPKLEDPGSAANEFLEDTEAVCRSFIANHPLTVELRRHILHHAKCAMPGSSPREGESSGEHRSSSDFISAPVPLPMSSLVPVARASKRSFSAAFPTTPCWMLTPCSATSPSLLHSTNVSVPSSVHAAHPASFPMIPSPYIRGTPGFYSLCRRFGTLQEGSSPSRGPGGSRGTRGGYPASSLLSENRSNIGVPDVVVSNHSSGSKEAPEPATLPDPSVGVTRLHPEGVLSAPKKIGDPSWSPLPGSAGIVRNLIEHIERKTPARIPPSSSSSRQPCVAAVCTKRGLVVRAGRANESCATPRSHVTFAVPAESCSGAGMIAIQSLLSLRAPVLADHRRPGNPPPEAFGATPIPVRKSISNAEESDSIPQPVSSPRASSMAEDAEAAETHGEQQKTVPPYSPATSPHRNEAASSSAPESVAGDHAAPTDNTLSAVLPQPAVDTAVPPAEGTFFQSAADAVPAAGRSTNTATACCEPQHEPPRVPTQPLPEAARAAPGVGHESTSASEEEERKAELEQRRHASTVHHAPLEKTTVEVVLEADEEHQAKLHQKHLEQGRPRKDAPATPAEQEAALGPKFDEVRGLPPPLAATTDRPRPMSHDPSMLDRQERNTDFGFTTAHHPKGANRELVGLVYPATRDEAAKIARGAPGNVMSVRFRGENNLIPLPSFQAAGSEQQCNDNGGEAKASPSTDANETGSSATAVADPPAQNVLGLPDTGSHPVLSASVVLEPSNNQKENDHALPLVRTLNNLPTSQGTPPPPFPVIHQPMEETKRMTPRLHGGERRMHRTLKKIPPKDMEDQADLSGEEDNPRVKVTGRKEASWAKNTKDWYRVVKQQLDIDPLSIFGCGVKPVLFEDIFQTPDFRRAAKDIMERNDPLRQRAPDLLCHEARHKQAKKWYQDEKLCGFREHEGVSKEDVAKFRRRVGRLKDISSLVWDSTWTICDHSCDHDSSLRQPWFRKLTGDSSPLCSSGRLNRVPSHHASGARRFMSPLPLSRADLPGVEEENEECLHETVPCGTPEGYTRGIFCTTGPTANTLHVKPDVSAACAPPLVPAVSSASRIGGGRPPHFKVQAQSHTAGATSTATAPASAHTVGRDPTHVSIIGRPIRGAGPPANSAASMYREGGMFRTNLPPGCTVPSKNPKETLSTLPSKNPSLSLFSKFRGKN